MESLLGNLEKYLRCPICLGTFTEPKTIQCLHTFCRDCLAKHARKTQQQGIFQCPECQARLGVPECFDKLPTGFLQNRLLGVFNVRVDRDSCEIDCGNCRKESAESFCFDCGIFMCPNCCSAHEILRNTAFKDHKVRAIDHLKPEDYGALLKRQRFCSQQYHEREITRFFCFDCETCVCQICIITEHKDHSIEALDKVADNEKSKIMAEVNSMKERNRACSDAVRELEKTATDLESNIKATKDRISQTANQMVATLRKREQEAIVALNHTLVTKMEKLNETKNQILSLQKQINQVREFAFTLVERSSSSDIVRNKGTLENRCEDLKKTAIPAVSVGSFLTFVPVEPESLSIGVIATNDLTIEGLAQDFQAGVEAQFVIDSKLEKDVRNLELIVKPTKQVGSLITSENKDGTFLAKIVPKFPGTYKLNVSRQGEKLHERPFTFQVQERRLEVVGELDLHGETLEGPAGVAVNSEGLIVVADYKGDRVLMFDTHGKCLCKFGCKGDYVGQLNSPCGVTFLDDHNILVADELNHRVQQFDVQTGDVVKVFGEKGSKNGQLRNPTGVCIDDEGRVIVADFFNSRIQVFSKDGKPVLRFGNSSPGNLNHPFECIFHGNNFIVSDAHSHCLKIFDRSGRFLHKIGKQGNQDGRLRKPLGLCMEKCNILVCNRGNNTIDQFSVEGSFTGKTVVEFPDPCGIATTPDDGRILVTSHEENKVFILK